MMAKNFRKIAKKLAGQAYQREQEKALDSLRRDFDRWRSGEIDCWELTDLIHRFHDGKSRELYKFYEMGSSEFALARAIALGILREEEVPADVQEQLRPMIEYFRDEHAEEDRNPADETR